MRRPCGCLADPAVFGHTCERYGPRRLSAALARLRAIRAVDDIRRLTAICPNAACRNPAHRSQAY